MIDLVLGTTTVIAIVGFFVVFGFALLAAGVVWTILKRQRNRGRRAEILDRLFDGSQHVVTRTGYTTLDATDVIRGGLERGYSLTSNDTVVHGSPARDLVFTRNHGNPA